MSATALEGADEAAARRKMVARMVRVDSKGVLDAEEGGKSRKVGSMLRVPFSSTSPSEAEGDYGLSSNRQLALPATRFRTFLPGALYLVWTTSTTSSGPTRQRRPPLVG